MKRILRLLLYIGILAAVFFVPVQKADVGQLRPVQLVSMYTEGQAIVIETDTEDLGVGVTVDEAFDNLEKTTPAIIYLDTADYLLVTEDALEYVDQLNVYLKENVQICRQEEPLDPIQTSKYLSVQGKLPKLKSWQEGAQLPVLKQFGERLFLIEKSENNA